MADSPRRIVRAPNHLGDVILALPALVADGSDVLVPGWLAPLVRASGTAGRVLPFERGLVGWWAAVRELRRRRYTEGVLLTPAFSAAWLFRWGAVRRLRGTATDGRGVLLSERIAPEALRPHHRINQYKLLLGQDPSGPATMRALLPPPEVVTRWRERLDAGTTPPAASPPEAERAANQHGNERPAARGRARTGSLVGLFPGANAPARRWPAERFAEVARALDGRGARVVVMGGPGERPLTRDVCSAAPRSLDLAGRTDVMDLAAVLSLCDLVVTNDTGPMHLAGAVGTPTVTLWGPSDPSEVGQPEAADVRVTGPELPCKPCYRNDCPRRGRGTVLAAAHEECMRLIEVRSVVEAVESLLERVRAP